MRLEGKVALVAGAAGPANMGQKIAERLAQEGCKVVVTGRHEEPLRAIAEQIGGNYILMDITSKADVDAAADFAVKTYGKLDIGVNATGWGLMKPTHETTETDLDKIMGIQFKGPFFFIQAMLRVMGQGGSIIQISSATATIMLENHAAYMGTKAGIDHVIRTVANEYGARGIRANSISPGLTETPMAGDSFSVKELIDAFAKEYPLGRLGTREDIAAAVVWLASDECFMTGQNLQVNGGLTLRRNPILSELGEIAARATAHLSS
ncbi:SDR family oxidoreductase [Sphingomonadales bacterium 56]|uniref:SDR family oxidoreductase n=1 Tax=unclassified Sphingobium TaxID=2611147 RepID=UPI001917AD9E|nr:MULTISPECIES: SDR family oxidoreductase [unclassified Sphingobium]MBY2930442.1 SDR family oxidoreductase [Sphingomonadales bacterium 56]MBY2960544.1 SDR family oxidoreductase [Sphingomonadales bacterium 58]CAD7341314.1 Glucose 1-dehydrogenase [Sphingobium sp. S6]CAD7341417.1 Glucose 1-dehydrogenase [Sphingobium sp. S8]